jgi:perosamine synthetase
MDPKRRYYFPIIGYNFRLTNVACAILCAQLERQETIIRKRQSLYSQYRRLLQGIPGIGLQPIAPWAVISPWLFSITVDPTQFGRSRDELMGILAEDGIETRPFFISLHELPPYRDRAKERTENLAISEQLSRSGMNLPTYTEMTSAQVERVAETIIKSAR